VDCYREAGYEIAMNVSGILNRLDFSEGAEVSYSGGIFKAGALVMDSFRDALEARGCTIVRPLAPPWVGALMSALQLVGSDSQEAIGHLIKANAIEATKEG
jgi:N-acetylglucosamine kinase-like BadF-type ATPase